MMLPLCAGCGSHYRPKNIHDPACAECHRWHGRIPPQYAQPGFREQHPAEWQGRFDDWKREQVAA